MIVAFMLQVSVHLSLMLRIFILYQLPEIMLLLVLIKGSYLYLNQRGFRFFLNFSDILLYKNFFRKNV